MDASFDSGLHALLLLARLHGVTVPAASMQASNGRETSRSGGELARIARTLGLHATLRRAQWRDLLHQPLPALVQLHGDGFVLLAGVRDGEVLVRRDDGALVRLAQAQFTAEWTGMLLVVSPRSAGGVRPTGLAWFLQHLRPLRGVLGEVLVLSLCLNLLGLLPPLVFQAVIDKVLVHQGWATLDVLCAGLLLVILFESVAGVARPRLLAHASSRLDFSMGRALFAHLLRVPLVYHEVRRVGDTLARVRELERIRAFLAGTAPTVLLDLLFVLVFCSMLVVWSPRLSLVVFLSLPVLALLVALSAPELQERIEHQFTRGADLQACLVETIANMRTVKTSALESAQTQRWATLSASALESAMRTQALGSLIAQATASVQKVVGVLLLWWGAHEVIAGNLTVGELVAFNLFAVRAMQPWLRLAQAWQEFVQIKVSLRRVDDLLTVPTEPGPEDEDTPPPALHGDIRFERVSFRHAPDKPLVLRHLEFRVARGEIVAVVGPSGSGKSTLTALLQRLYLPSEGRIFIDDRDIAHVNGAHLRRHIGVVSQDCRLFNRTIRENIAMRDDSLPLETVMDAARTAGAHDFIAALPAGYDTLVSEQAVSLSGGQVQRIALARALVCEPAILVLDEFTSALDAATESFLLRQLPSLAAGRTVILVTHRQSLAALADRVLVLMDGCLVQQGHPALLARLSGPYQRLWQEPAPPPADPSRRQP